MAGLLVKLPKRAVEELLDLSSVSIVEIAARLGPFIAVLCFASFMYAMWLPKVVVATKHAGGHRCQPPSAALQKKKIRAKRNKKTRNVGLSKATVDVEVLADGDETLEEGLELVTVQAGTSQAAKLKASFDEEAPPTAHDAKETRSDGILDFSMVTAGRTDRVSNWHVKKLGLVPQALSKHTHRTSYASGTVDENMQVQNVADDQILKHTELKELTFGEIDHQATKSCEIYVAPTFGCADHRQYTSSLLLLHRELHIQAARGPPGLPKPAVRVSPATASIRCVSV